MLRVLTSLKMLGLHLVTIVLVVVMVNLAFWQLTRHNERVTFNESVRARSLDAPRSLSDLLSLARTSDTSVANGSVDARDLEWYLLQVSGEYLAGEDLLLVNLSQDGRAGVDPISALRVADGRVLLVNRGFIPLSQTAPPPPSGEVTLIGRVRAPQERRRGELTDPASGELREIQRIDPARLAEQLPDPVLPFYVDLLQSNPPDAPVLSRIAEPELTLGPHLSYVVQWFVFSACAIAAWAFIVRRALVAARQATTST